MKTGAKTQWYECESAYVRAPSGLRLIGLRFGLVAQTDVAEFLIRYRKCDEARPAKGVSFLRHFREFSRWLAVSIPARTSSSGERLDMCPFSRPVRFPAQCPVPPRSPLLARASVMIPLCNVDGVASVLFTKRASTMRAHKNEVCFPGGKVRLLSPLLFSRLIPSLTL